MKFNKSALLKIVKKNFTQKKACYYRILGLQTDASKTDIKRKFIELAKEYHPDINKDEASQKIFKEISEAYGILSNNDLKRQYDEKIYAENNYKEKKFNEEEDRYSENMKNMSKEEFENMQEEMRKENWKKRKNDQNYNQTKDYLNKKYFDNDYEFKDPLKSWNFDIELEKKKNDKEKEFFENHTRFRRGEVYEYWEKDEDLKSYDDKIIFVEVLRENGAFYNSFIGVGITFVGLYFFYPNLLNNIFY